jgi:hypothetical protein
MTTELGYKVSNPDNWLKVVSNDRVGAHFLEDQVGQEKVDPIDVSCYQISRNQGPWAWTLS